MEAVKYELTSLNAEEVLNELAQRVQGLALASSEEANIVIDCTALCNLNYESLQRLIKLRPHCVFIGTHKLEASLQRYGISSLNAALPSRN